MSSYGCGGGQLNMRTTRQRLFPSIGYLYPAGTSRLAEVVDEQGLERALEVVPDYHKLWTSIQVRRGGREGEAPSGSEGRGGRQGA